MPCGSARLLGSAVRLCEVAKLLADVTDFGLIRPNPDGLLRPDAQDFLKLIPEQARRCVDVAAETSPVRNHLIMQRTMLSFWCRCCNALSCSRRWNGMLKTEFDQSLKEMKSRLMIFG
jgi:hypothetical protein